MQVPTNNQPTTNHNKTKRRSAEDWRALIESCNQSTLSIKEFCHQHQITVSNYYQWRKKLSPSSDINDFIELPASKPHSISATSSDDWQVELQLGTEITLRVRVS